MTPDQWRTIRDTVQANWGNSGKWANAAHLARDVMPLDYKTMRDVVAQIRDAGEPHPPSPGELIGKTKQRTGQHTMTSERTPPEHCRHTIEAVTDYATTETTRFDYTTPTMVICAHCLTDLPVEPLNQRQDPLT